MNLEVLVEERSAEQALRVLLPRIVPDASFEVRVFQGKVDLLKRLPDRLKGYSTWIARADTCLVVLIDRDDDDCLKLKAVHGCLHRWGSGRSTDAPMRFSVVPGKHWSTYFRSMVTTQVVWPRSWQLPRSRNT